MSLRLPSYMFCLVSSSSSVICNYTIVQSSTVHTVIQITFIHTFIQLYIHTSILSHINAYTTYKQYQSIHGCISCPNLVSAISFQISLYLSLYQSAKSEQPDNLHLPFTFIICQVTSPKQWTARVYLSSFSNRQS